MKDYYKILQVNKEASSEVISKVYKILAKKYHPDANPDNKFEAEEKFKEISEAYEILSNEEKRKNYNLEFDSQTENQNSNTVPIEEFIKLRDYCKELEDAINSINNSSHETYNSSETTYNQNNYNSNNYSNNYNSNYQEKIHEAEQKAYQDAINRAYHDAYINNLKNMGYKIHYKQTFKEKLKNLLALIITFSLIALVLYILWHIPSMQAKIKSLFLF